MSEAIPGLMMWYILHNSSKRKRDEKRYGYQPPEYRYKDVWVKPSRIDWISIGLIGTYLVSVIVMYLYLLR